MRKAFIGIAAGLSIGAAAPALSQEGLIPAPNKSAYRSIAEFHSQAEFDAVANAVASGKLITVPTWSHGFSIQDTRYSYTLIGSRPQSGEETVIPTIIVPIRLTISDYLVHGKPLIL